MGDKLKKLTRLTEKGNIRYYELELSKTLFGEYVVERIYGNVAYKSFTGRRINSFLDEASAANFFQKIIDKKAKKGYV